MRTFFLEHVVRQELVASRTYAVTAGSLDEAVDKLANAVDSLEESDWIDDASISVEGINVPVERLDPQEISLNTNSFAVLDETGKTIARHDEYELMISRYGQAVVRFLEQDATTLPAFNRAQDGFLDEITAIKAEFEKVRHAAERAGV